MSRELEIHNEDTQTSLLSAYGDPAKTKRHKDHMIPKKPNRTNYFIQKTHSVSVCVNKSIIVFLYCGDAVWQKKKENHTKC